MNIDIDDNRIHEGHRERMRSKLFSHGQKIFDTYELLEMLLYYIVPYKDTNPIAKRLLMRFGSLDGVLRADPRELVEVSGVGESAAKFLVWAGKCQELLGLSFGISERPVCDSFALAGRHFVDYFERADRYIVAVALLDNSMRVLQTVELYHGDYDKALVKPDKFIEAAIKNRASAVLTAHCHPYGPFFPTEGDRATNSLITDSLKSVGVIHLEHFIVCGGKYMGIMEHTKECFSAFSGIYSFLVSKELAIATGEASVIPKEHMNGVYYADFSDKEIPRTGMPDGFQTKKR